jgi:hypothetical protein
MIWKQNIMTLDQPNKNGRVYSMAIGKKIEGKYETLFGGVGFREDGKMLVKDISHKVSEIKLEGNEVVATIEPLPETPEGKRLLDMLEKYPDKFVFRTGGIGNLVKQEDGTYLVQDDYQLVSVDLVPKETAG